VARNWKKARQKVDLEGGCRVCGSDYMIEAAHSSYIRFDDNTVDPDRVIPLCKQCHMKYDAHELDILAYISYEEQAIVVRDLGIVRAYKRLTGESILEN
jgi:hypothetical protein